MGQTEGLVGSESQNAERMAELRGITQTGGNKTVTFSEGRQENLEGTILNYLKDGENFF